LAFCLRPLKRLRTWLLRLYVHYFVQADSRAKCPGGGIRAKHDLRWVEIYEKVVHVCGRCHVAWADAPIVDARRWKLQLDVVEDETANPDGTTTSSVQHAQREPIIVNEAQLTGRKRPLLRIAGQ
jgi:hypothetical protein